ncbi:MAG: hypothetical protein ACRD20_20550 [Terriglobales bacterium]
MKPHLKLKLDFDRYERFCDWRNYIEQVWERAKTPIKFPAPSRRRRENREIPKAA